jgi:hypothetical protein
MSEASEAWHKAILGPRLDIVERSYNLAAHNDILERCMAGYSCC